MNPKILGGDSKKYIKYFRKPFVGNIDSKIGRSMYGED